MAKKKQQIGGSAVIRFTGKGGGTLYNYAPGQMLRRGETVEVSLPLEAHWVALLKSRNAEVL